MRLQIVHTYQISVVVTLCVLSVLSMMPMRSQPLEFRMEKIPLLTESATLRGSPTKYYARMTSGYYVFDSTGREWRHLGSNTAGWSSPELLNFQPNGVATIGANPVMRIRPDTDIPELRDSVGYRLEHDDSIVCLVVERAVTAAQITVIFRWWNWTTSDTLQRDTIILPRSGSKILNVICGDTTMLCVYNNMVFKSRFGSALDTIAMPHSVVDDTYHSTVGIGLTHILLNAGDSWLYSADHGRSWIIVPKGPESCWGIQTSPIPNELIAPCPGRLLRIRLPDRRVDTLLLDGAMSGYTQIAPGPMGVLVNLHDSIYVIDGATKQHRRIDRGLPTQTVTDMIYVQDGIAAMSKREVAYRPSGGEWSVLLLPDSASFYRQDGYDRRYYHLHRFVGGRSFDDLWMNRLYHIQWHRPRGKVHSSMMWPPPFQSHWADEDGSRVLIARREERNYRMRWHNLDDREEFLPLVGEIVHVMAFADTAFVALCQDGSYWRTVGGDLNTWELRRLPARMAAGLWTSETKGQMGLLSSETQRFIAYDGGLYWREASADLNSVATITAGGLVYSALVDIDPVTGEAVLRVHQEVGDTKVVIAEYPLENHRNIPNLLLDLAYDDREHRLFIAMEQWVASLAIVPTTSVEDRSVSRANIHAYGCYDVLGRRIADKIDDVSSPGTFIIVDASGVRKVLHPGH